MLEEYNITLLQSVFCDSIILKKKCTYLKTKKVLYC